MGSPKQSPPKIPAEYHYILEQRCFPVVVTLRKDGLMSANPVSLLWDGETIRISTQKARMKYKNLVHDERITLCIMDPADPLCYIEVRGTAIIEDDPDRSYINAVARKYLDMDEYPYDMPGDERVVVTVVPQQVSARGIKLSEGDDGSPVKTG